MNHYYFYLQDREWGPAFLKVGTYLPYPVRVCLNGHEWAKQQLRQVGIGFSSPDNGFLACDDPPLLQAICDELGPADVQRFFDRWQAHLPWPLTAADRLVGYRHRLSIWQLEVSRTQVFDQPIQGRHFFEAVIRDNLDLGRPDRVSLLFPTQLTRRTPPPAHGYRTRVITAGVAPSLHVEYKHSHVKQYFKEERALRTETTINDPTDFQPRKALETLPQLRATGAQINQQVLTVERLSHDCSLNQDTLAQLQTSRQQGTQRIPALRFGDPRVVALLQALCRFAQLPAGFRNRELRPHVAALLGRELTTYSRGAMTYDLRRLRLHGLIQRIAGPNATPSPPSVCASPSSAPRSTCASCAQAPPPSSIPPTNSRIHSATPSASSTRPSTNFALPHNSTRRRPKCDSFVRKSLLKASQVNLKAPAHTLPAAQCEQNPR